MNRLVLLAGVVVTSAGLLAAPVPKPKPDWRLVCERARNEYHALDLDSGEKTALRTPDENPKGHDNSLPVWSPDGRRKAWVRSHDDEYTKSRTFDVVVADADGKNEVKLEADRLWWAGRPAWSPDGKTLYLMSFGMIAYSQNGELFAVAAGEKTPQVISTRQVMRASELMPTAKGVRFFGVIPATDTTRERCELVTIENGKETVTPLPDDYTTGGHVSPDGTRIAFVKADRWNVLVVHDLVTGKRGEWDVFKEQKGWGVEQIYLVRWKPDGSGFAFAARNAARGEGGFAHRIGFVKVDGLEMTVAAHETDRVRTGSAPVYAGLHWVDGNRLEK